MQKTGMVLSSGELSTVNWWALSSLFRAAGWRKMGMVQNGLHNAELSKLWKIFRKCSVTNLAK